MKCREAESPPLLSRLSNLAVLLGLALPFSAIINTLKKCLRFWTLRLSFQKSLNGSDKRRCFFFAYVHTHIFTPFRLFGISTPKIFSRPRSLLENVSPFQPGLYRITPPIPSEQNSTMWLRHSLCVERCRAPLCPQRATLPRKIKGTLRAVEIYRKSFSPCVRKSFYINTTVCPFIFRRECGTDLAGRGEPTI